MAGVCSNTKFKQGGGTLIGRICSIYFVLQCVFELYTLVVALSKFLICNFGFKLILFFIVQSNILKCYFATSAEHLFSVHLYR